MGFRDGLVGYLQQRGAAYVAYTWPERVLAQLEAASLLAQLSPDEQARYTRFRFPDDAAVYLVAHALTRRVLARALGCDPRALSFALREHGRPELAGPAAASGLRFNLSHTRGLVACGIAAHDDLGVDVEELGRRVEIEGLARRVFSPRERAGLDALSGEAQRARFFELWTLKEAYVKATGKGLASPLQGISFLAEQPDPVPIVFDDPSHDDASRWTFRRHPVDTTHYVSAALKAGGTAAISFEALCGEDLLG
ncbi:MAG: 4'-phosphopantetheinyl transferase superfamily protein [Polyangiales bacterium]